jgi:hypothetical protein
MQADAVAAEILNTALQAFSDELYSELIKAGCNAQAAAELSNSICTLFLQADAETLIERALNHPENLG